MKRLLMILVLLASLLAFVPMPTLAGGRHGGGPHGRYNGHAHWSGGHYRSYRGHGVWYGGGPRFYGGLVIGPSWWGAPYPYWYYPPNYVYVTPPAVLPGPSVYIQQQAGAPAEAADAAWYYCPSTKAYYPTVQTCREAWIKVPPRPE